MKFVCKKTDLLKGVNIVLKAVPSKTTMSILECILIDASAGQIKMTANDMELGIETVIEGDIREKGIIAIVIFRTIDLYTDNGIDPISVVLAKLQSNSSGISVGAYRIPYFLRRICICIHSRRIDSQ